MFNKSEKAITLPKLEEINSYKNHFHSTTLNEQIIGPPYSFDI